MDKSVIESIARNIRVERAKQNITILELAEHSGVNVSTLSKIENAKKTTIRPSTLEKVARALNVDLQDLVK